MGKKKEPDYEKLSEDEYLEEFEKAFIEPMERYEKNFFYRVYIHLYWFGEGIKKFCHNLWGWRKLEKWNERFGEGKIICQLSLPIPENFEITRWVNSLKLPPSIVDETLEYYNLKKKRHFRKRESLESRTAAALFITCQKNNLPVSLEKLSAASGETIEDIQKSLKILKRPEILDFPSKILNNCLLWRNRIIQNILKKIVSENPNLRYKRLKR